MDIPERSSFSFQSRPIPVPGDLRISWRLALILLMLGRCRAKRASLVKLHLLNDAIRSGRTHDQLEAALAGERQLWLWPVRVEPAFGRALDFVVGDGLAEWTQTSQRAAIQLTKVGIAAWEALDREADILPGEKALIDFYASRLTEATVSTYLTHSRGSE